MLRPMTERPNVLGAGLPAATGPSTVNAFPKRYCLDVATAKPSTIFPGALAIGNCGPRRQLPMCILRRDRGPLGLPIASHKPPDLTYHGRQYCGP